MKGTDHFKELIKKYLDKRASEDELFRARYKGVNRPIDDIVTYIINEVKKSGVCGWSDDEVFSLAIHAAEEAELEVGKPMNCDVVVNRHIELTDEEKAEQKALALKRFQDEELRKLQTRNVKPKPSKPKENQQPELSLFDF